MKTGRNEPCPCGSGKRYKVCCEAAPDTESPQMLAWRRLGRAVQDHAPKLLNFIAESHGREAIPEAWEEFTLRSGEPFDPQSPQVTLFYPWMFHVWRPLFCSRTKLWSASRLSRPWMRTGAWRVMP